jgi:hypothetical protein
LTFLFTTIFCEAQYIGRYTLDNDIENFTLIDITSETKFILDFTQIYVTAIDKDGNQLWRTDPWKDNNLMEYRVKRPIIVFFHFTTMEEKMVLNAPRLMPFLNKEVIWIIYNNTQFGIIDKLTGEFIFFGQD